MSEYARLIVNAYKKVVRYTAPQMAEHTPEDDFSSCYTSCMNTALIIASIFGVGVYHEPGKMYVEFNDTNLIESVLSNDVVILMYYPIADHYLTIVIHDNICYLCESLQDQYTLKVHIISRHDLLVLCSRFLYGPGSEVRKFETFPLNGNIHTSVRNYEIWDFSKKDRMIIDMCKAKKSKYEPEIIDLTI